MADAKNPGQFGNRPDTSEQASKGGKASGASGAAGKTEAAKRGGQNSRRKS